jgi:hypothetical protein
MKLVLMPVLAPVSHRHITRSLIAILPLLVGSTLDRRACPEGYGWGIAWRVARGARIRSKARRGLPARAVAIVSGAQLIVVRQR